jgi:acyl transferase domain-containing protein/acyl carrier protein
VDSSLRENPNYVPIGSVLEDIDCFDAAFFGISPREAESLDPQHRFFLETAWHALEDAGYDPEQHEGLVGVYGGCAVSTYLAQVQRDPEFMALLGYLQVYIGNDKDYLTSRVSYSLNLKGPSFSIQTACSTSLLSIAIASDQLVSGQCDMALAGGVCVRVPQHAGYLYEPGGIYSPDGHCRVFDEKASGVVFGNGVGVVVLRRLSDALRDRDSIYAVIRGWAVNNDGSGKASYAAPSLEGQAEVITRAHKMAGVSAGSITYVEAHGTGTAVGDPIEVGALTKAFRRSTDRQRYCAIGSVKTNVGHLDPAAGVTSLIKTALALHKSEIPPSLNCDSPNPAIDFEDSPFFVNRELSQWRTTDGPRRAGVSAFGIGGTNVHVVLEEAPGRYESRREDETDPQLLVLSARTTSALESVVENLYDHMNRNPDEELENIAYTLQVGRKSWNRRCATVVESREELTAVLEEKDPRRLLAAKDLPRPRVVSLMFSGQGAQYVNMARELYKRDGQFAESLDRCFDLLAPLVDVDLRKVLYPAGEVAEDANQALTQTRITQPVLFSLEYSLAQWWLSLGVQPASMIGHSIGEYVAACLAGVFSVEDGLKLVAARGQLMQELPRGSMLAVQLDEDEVGPYLTADLDVAAVNEPSSTVISGPSVSVEEAERRLLAKGIPHRRLQTSHAFHSGMMDPILEQFARLVEQIDLRNPEIPYISNVTGSWITSDEATSPKYWARHLRSSVRFMDGLGRLLVEDDRALIEVGPGRSLTGFARRHPQRQSGHVVLSSLPPPDDRRADSFLLESLGQLWLAGVDIEWSQLHDKKPRHRVHLPVYPYERRRCWVSSSSEAELADAAPAMREPDLSKWFYLPEWRSEDAPPSEVAKTAYPWVIFEDGGCMAEVVVSHLEGLCGEVVRVSPGSRFTNRGVRAYEVDPKDRASYEELFAELRRKSMLPRSVLHLWNAPDSDGSQFAFDKNGSDGSKERRDAEDRGFYSLIYIARALAKAHVTHNVDVISVTSEAYGVDGDKDVIPTRALVTAAARAIPQEYPNLRCRTVDVDPETVARDNGQIAARHILAEVCDTRSYSTVAFRGDRRLVQEFHPTSLDEVASSTTRLRESGVYLITGGLGKIGLTLAEHLAGTTRGRLVLVGRSAPPKDAWSSWIASHGDDDSTTRAIRRVQRMEANGSEVLVVPADVSRLDSLTAAVACARQRFGQLNGVIHAAGNVRPEGFFGVEEADRELCARQFEAKVDGTIALARAVAGEELDFVVLLSSISSVLAGLGYIGYAAANVFMDAFAQKMRLSSSVPWININLDSWDEDGADGAREPHILAMSATEGVEVFRRVLAFAHPSQVVVSTGDLNRRIQQWVDVDSLRTARRRHDAEGDNFLTRPDWATSYVGPRNELEAEIAAVIEEVLGVANVGALDNFFTDLGGTSLLGTQLVSRLRQRFSVELPLRQFFDGPTVGDLGMLIQAERDPVKTG